MSVYELMIISGDGEAAFSKVEKFLKDVEASNVKSEKMGRKQLAYPISKLTEADYLLYHFEAETQAIAELVSRISLEQEVILRHLLTVYNPKVEKKAKVSTDKQEVKPLAKVTVKTASKEEKVTKEKKEKVEKPKKQEKEKKAAKKGKK